MAIFVNSNLDTYAPEFWNEIFISLNYADRPQLGLASRAVLGQQLKGQKFGRNIPQHVAKQVEASAASKSTDGTFGTTDTGDISKATITPGEIAYKKWKISKFDLQADPINLVQMYMMPNMDRILAAVEADLRSELDAFQAGFTEGISGGSALTPTILNADNLTEAKRILNTRMFSHGQHVALVDGHGLKDLTDQSLFQQANQRGSNQVQMTGEIDNAFGFSFFTSDVKGTASPAGVGNAVVAANAAIGATTITIDDDSGSASSAAFSVGDMVAFTSSPTSDDWYMVDSVNSTTTSLKLLEPLRAAVSNNDTLSVISASGSREYFYDPNAISLISGTAPAVAGQGAGIRESTGFLPRSNINYSLTVTQTDEGATFTMYTLYGVKNFYPNRGVIYTRGSSAKV